MTAAALFSDVDRQGPVTFHPASEPGSGASENRPSAGYEVQEVKGLWVRFSAERGG
jgi:hypothetical protein